MIEGPLKSMSKAAVSGERSMFPLFGRRETTAAARVIGQQGGSASIFWRVGWIVGVPLVSYSLGQYIASRSSSSDSASASVSAEAAQPKNTNKHG
jgi:hypothetical protein